MRLLEPLSLRYVVQFRRREPQNRDPWQTMAAFIVEQAADHLINVRYNHVHNVYEFCVLDLADNKPPTFLPRIWNYLRGHEWRQKTMKDIPQPDHLRYVVQFRDVKQTEWRTMAAFDVLSNAIDLVNRYSKITDLYEFKTIDRKEI